MSADAEGSPTDPPPAARRRCPICGRPAVAAVSPFCSRRCADVDLHRWLGEAYRVPAEPDEDARDRPGDEPV